MTHFVRVFSVVFVLALLVLSEQIISNSIENQNLKKDHAEINHIKYGLFSVDVWKKQLEVIVADEIGDFDLGRANEKDLKAQLQIQLGILIDKVEDRIRDSNKGTFKGRIKQAVFNSVVDMKEVKAGVPDYTDAIMAELKKAKNERQIKKVVKKEVTKYFKKSFDSQDRTSLNQVLQRAGTSDLDEAKLKIANEIDSRQRVIQQQAILMIGLAVLLFVLVGSKKTPIEPLDYFALLTILFLLLVVGVATPMIDMEAKISSMNFVLLDHEISFKDQILYFQSKSIMDVFWIMISSPELPMKCVGLLVVTFSVLFPLTKMFSSYLYYFDFRSARKNRIIEFFVLKSGKWSMSDILVVAIFMAYIGFSGILSSQLGKLSEFAGDIDLLTTNGTTLQPGFYLFLTYVLLGMCFALLLSRRTHQHQA